MVDIQYFDHAVELMDDEIREAIHATGEYTTDEAFLREYEKRHYEMYSEEFSV